MKTLKAVQGESIAFIIYGFTIYDSYWRENVIFLEEIFIPPLLEDYLSSKSSQMAFMIVFILNFI